MYSFVYNQLRYEYGTRTSTMLTPNFPKTFSNGMMSVSGGTKYTLTNTSYIEILEPNGDVLKIIVRRFEKLLFVVVKYR